MDSHAQAAEDKVSVVAGGSAPVPSSNATRISYRSIFPLSYLATALERFLMLSVSSFNTRLHRLLVRGFYPRELPPPFRTRNFTKVLTTLSPPARYSGSTTFFRGANHRGEFRTFGVVNPINYFILSRFIARHWTDINRVYSRSSSSGTVPRFPTKRAAGRALRHQSIGDLRAIQHRIASTFPIIMHLDIGNFYGSIYTHAIPWAVLGKREAKTRHKNRTLAGHWSDTLDNLVRNGNQQQTIGIPIGPDTSRIISELILSRIDADLTSRSDNTSAVTSRQLFHYIDDYQVGAYTAAEAETYQANFVKAIGRYELRLNDFKTRIDHGLSSHATPFEHRFAILEGKDGITFVEHFFDVLSAETARLPHYNIAGYALKAFARSLLGNSERPLIANYLQRFLFASPSQAPLRPSTPPYDIPTGRLRRTQSPTHSCLGHRNKRASGGRHDSPLVPLRRHVPANSPERRNVQYLHRPLLRTNRPSPVPRQGHRSFPAFCRRTPSTIHAG